jgi:2'-5' RNA ligase
MESEKILTRCFICIEIPREVIDYLEELQKILKNKNLFHGKLTEPENFHLTLKFLGEIPEEKIKQVQEYLKKIKIPSFTANLGELGLFANKVQKILWIKINGRGIFEIQKIIDEEMEKINFKKESRFMSHLTLARIKNISDKTIFLDYIKNLKTKKIKFEVKEIFLKKSDLKPEGPIYTNLEQIELEK